MANSIFLTKDFETNGIKIPAGQVSTDDIRSAMRGPRGGAITDEAAQSVLDDLARRQQKYNTYQTGITEKHEYLGSVGNVAMGGSE